ncbi:hypothetical protein O3M35_012097 [Rhynocoris fuscipes]|uniref:Uncharacterized protein n=1 Tax=Rhynocoris fuscipes TaxID=488301 RepID=A0AAW1CSA4_9HEMI
MGVVVLSTAGFVTMIISGVINFYVPNDTAEDAQISQYITFVMTTSTLLMGFLVIFFAGFWEHIDMTTVGTNLIVAGSIIWLILLIISFITSINFPIYMWVCISGVRCPDTMWIFDARWRYSGYDCPPRGMSKSWITPEKDVKEYAMFVNESNLINLMRNVINNTNATLMHNEINQSFFPGCDVGGGGFILYSILTSVGIAAFLFNTIMICLNFRQELIDIFTMFEV